MKNNKGFSLLEMLIVISILSVVLLMTMPQMHLIMDTFKTETDMILARQLSRKVDYMMMLGCFNHMNKENFTLDASNSKFSFFGELPSAVNNKEGFIVEVKEYHSFDESESFLSKISLDGFQSFDLCAAVYYNENGKKGKKLLIKEINREIK